VAVAAGRRQKAETKKEERACEVVGLSLERKGRRGGGCFSRLFHPNAEQQETLTRYHRIWGVGGMRFDQMGLNTDKMPLCPDLSSAVASLGLVDLALRMDDVRKTAIVCS
jgi:hypothetical protein